MWVGGGGGGKLQSAKRWWVQQRLHMNTRHAQHVQARFNIHTHTHAHTHTNTHTNREASITEYETSLDCLPGDVVVASSFMSYAGPFPSEYRDELVRATWLPQVCVCVCALPSEYQDKLVRATWLPQVCVNCVCVCVCLRVLFFLEYRNELFRT